MARFIKSRKNSLGKSPGSLIFIGNRKMDQPEIHVMVYSKDSLIEKKVETVDEIPEPSEDSVLWVNIYGLQDTDLIAKAGELFSIHPLELEDIMNTDQRPKVAENESNLTFFLKILQYHEDTGRVSGDQVSIVLGKNTVVTFQEKPAQFFDPVRNRIRNNRGKIRHSGADYLVYTLIDTLVDSYIHSIECLGSAMEEMEKEVLQHARKSTLENIYRMKTNVGLLRKSVFPLKEIMLILNKTESKFIQKKTINYLKDLNDLTTQVLETIEIYHNMANDYLNIYHSNVANRTNEIMKVLTIFASIFIPLTFIAGVYGTNFENLPELHFKYGYYLMLGLMAIVAGGMLYYFRKKKWL